MRSFQPRLQKNFRYDVIIFLICHRNDTIRSNDQLMRDIINWCSEIDFTEVARILISLISKNSIFNFLN
jgi:hypothetical protein